MITMANIIGLGLDATDIERIAATIERYGERFVHRVFTDGEVAYCKRRRVPAIHFAGRFAAKEAAMKALGTGHSQGRALARYRGGPPRRAAATEVAWWRRQTIHRHERSFLAADHHAFRRSRDGAGSDPRRVTKLAWNETYVCFVRTVSAALVEASNRRVTIFRRANLRDQAAAVRPLRQLLKPNQRTLASSAATLAREDVRQPALSSFAAGRPDRRAPIARVTNARVPCVLRTRALRALPAPRLIILDTPATTQRSTRAANKGRQERP